jgi:zinc protease
MEFFYRLEYCSDYLRQSPLNWREIIMRLAPIIAITAVIAFLSACQYNEQKLRVDLDVASNVVQIDGITLLEKVVAEPGEILIPYQKYRLENGLTVILHRDDSDPLVHVDVTYHVGSAREELGKSGFAHFFEHMMFQGSENVADEQHFKLVTEAGGSMNGTTNSDRTNYYQAIPANQLGQVLWLEADRMGFLLDAVTQEKFEV